MTEAVMSLLVEEDGSEKVKKALMKIEYRSSSE